MNKKILISTSLLLSFLAYGCSSSSDLTQVQPVDSIESLAAKSKTLSFKHAKSSETKKTDININPNPKDFSVTIKKIVSKNSANPSANQVYATLSSALENLAQIDVSHGMTDGTDNYENAKVMSTLVNNTNRTLMSMSSGDSSLQGVFNVISIMTLNYSSPKWSNNGKFSYKYADQKFFSALTYKFLLDSYDGENFNLTLQKVAAHFAQFPSFAQDFRDASFYMFDAVKFMSDKVPALSYIKQQAEPNNESWQIYSTRLRTLLLQVSKMTTF